ncbi:MULTISPECIES: prolipoprotein diacylglyceryl transferase [Rhizobiaceae]|uniref:Phosphatidylglycerol--prolipoprotein diacylglyceryl transferase n=1 Tax=Aliirhizobium cellulosilyticum TaxID=393664 RepID=A0A7W6S6E0_9HYPH|nr:prolipoprotein diacylglyceryl transferase [Rhizobium cellulosilyticum]MBB4347217.1 phosphatidylglycerol:prolipoprotein diacylglycerol transferase [Rhizobium cellulosilyticum]MBB4410389.1 phosphatidylglycerol:prolipoprotein diacylglycerol transferase [Rhizobium cellulosilyticum]MBB4445076.1 phosphatidylglycerol:prolipoprotein diacylglycerol transferase [Rhizobium cellulosilyticum]
MYEALNFLAILPFPDIDPVAFAIGPLAVHWYGLAYVAGIMIGWLYARKLIDRPTLWKGDAAPMTKTHLDDFLVWIAVGIVVGGRTGYVLFYDLPVMLENPIRIIQIWNGGMSFHGGLMGAIVAMILFARKNVIPVWSMFDIIAAVVPIGLLFGRIANFINGELWGRLSSAPWAIVFPTGGPFARHPSQLYEAALEGILLLLLLASLIFGIKAFKKPGLIAGIFVMGYGLSRIFVEFFREPDAQLGYLLGTNWLTMGMVLSSPMVLIGLWAALRALVAARTAKA